MFKKYEANPIILQQKYFTPGEIQINIDHGVVSAIIPFSQLRF